MKFPTSYILETERCILRHVSKEDFPQILSATSVSGFNDGMQWDPPEKEVELLDPYNSQIKAWDDGSEYVFSIDEKRNKEFVGRISILHEGKDVWNIGFWTHPKKQNEGFMSEAVKAVLRFGFEELEAIQIVACHALWNKASEKVLLKSGMNFLEYLPQGFKKRGQWVEENKLQIGRNEWFRTKRPFRGIPHVTLPKNVKI